MLGYDNAHRHNHRHYLVIIEPIEFTSFEDIEGLFEKKLYRNYE